jgi:lipopolysaccharide biosynthesis regulator YciM
MTGAYTPLLAALIALLVGLAVGKAWERYKLRDGRWFDRRKARETPHYMLGLNFLVSNQADLAIEELTKAATVDSDALEIDLILGNLYREKGQVGRARPCCSDRSSSAWSTPTRFCVSGWTTRAAASSIGR